MHAAAPGEEGGAGARAEDTPPSLVDAAENALPKFTGCPSAPAMGVFPPRRAAKGEAAGLERPRARRAFRSLVLSWASSNCNSARSARISVVLVTHVSSAVCWRAQIGGMKEISLVLVCFCVCVCVCVCVYVCVLWACTDGTFSEAHRKHGQVCTVHGIIKHSSVHHWTLDAK